MPRQAEMRNPSPEPLASREAGYEVSDANSEGIFITGFAALFIGFLIHLALWWLFLTYKRDAAVKYPPRSALAPEQTIPPEPRLQLNPHEDLLQMRREHLGVLNSAGWVDQKAGIARIPIDDAMKLFLEEQRGKAK